MKATFPVVFLNLSDRISGTDKEGHAYDYRRVTLMIQGEPVVFTIRANSPAAKMVPRFSSCKEFEKLEVVLDFAKARDRSYYYCNLVEFVEV